MFSHDALFSVKATDLGGILTLQLAGELDVATAPMLGQAVDELVGPALHGLTLDLQRLSFVDVLGIRALVEARNAAISVNAQFALQGVGERTLRVIRLVGPRLLEDAILAVPGSPRAS